MDESTTTGEGISNVIHDLDFNLFLEAFEFTQYTLIYIRYCIPNAKVST